jgi:cation diffusion facilitator CzcD-associated flavoprotein CzcO
VEKLTLFQRTAQWIMPQQNPPFSEEDRAEFHHDPERLTGLHERLSELFGGFSAAVIDASSPLMANIEQLCLDNLEQNVHDPELRERLRPDYRAACKRLIVSPNFYEAIQRPNAELVTDAIECVEPGGVRTKDGRVRELDVLVLATGFRVDSFLRPMRVFGRDGVSLSDAWTPRPNAYLSITVPGFPNLFMLNGPNGPVGNFSLIEIAETQFAYIAQLLALLDLGVCREISAAQEAMDAFECERVEAAKRTIWATGCRSWYLDDRGVPASWPWTLDRFRSEMATPKLEAYDLR